MLANWNRWRREMAGVRLGREREGVAAESAWCHSLGGDWSRSLTSKLQALVYDILPLTFSSLYTIECAGRRCLECALPHYMRERRLKLVLGVSVSVSKFWVEKWKWKKVRWAQPRSSFNVPSTTYGHVVKSRVLGCVLNWKAALYLKCVLLFVFCCCWLVWFGLVILIPPPPPPPPQKRYFICDVDCE